MGQPKIRNQRIPKLWLTALFRFHSFLRRSILPFNRHDRLDPGAMTLTPLDAATCVVLFIVYVKSNNARDAFERIRNRKDFLDTQRQKTIDQGQWNQDSEANYRSEIKEIYRANLQYWIGPNSFVAGICGALASLSLGITSIPGFLISLAISSPRFLGYCATILGILSRAGKSGA